MIKCSAIILAGGKSSRMNYFPKALLEYNEKTFIEREINALKDFDEIIISCNDEKVKESVSEFKIVEDKIKDIGPIGGIYSTLSEVKNDKAIIISCDMPFLKKEILNWLGNMEFEEECLVPILNGEIEPFCGVYKKEILEKIRRSIQEENYSLRRILRSLNIKKIEINDENNFTNINTTTEYDNLITGD